MSTPRSHTHIAKAVMVSDWRNVASTEHMGVTSIHLKYNEIVYTAEAGDLLSLQYRGGPSIVPYTNNSYYYCPVRPLYLKFSNTSTPEYKVGDKETFKTNIDNSTCIQFSFKAILTVMQDAPFFNNSKSRSCAMSHNRSLYIFKIISFTTGHAL